MEAAALRVAVVEGRKIAYRELGTGQPILLLHGWPTSSLLWRGVMPELALEGRVIAPDLPGFGASDKPLDIQYSFAFFDAMLDGFCAALGLDSVALGVHDMGGPIGLHWALSRPARLRKLALLNTLIYPEFCREVKEFVRRCATPELRDELTSPKGLESLLREGVHDPNRVSPELLDAIQAPFREPAARTALAQAAIGLHLRGFHRIAKALPRVGVPVRIVYGERDRVLPDIAETMARVQRDLPHACATPLPQCGHFLQEDAPETVSALMAEFFGS